MRSGLGDLRAAGGWHRLNEAWRADTKRQEAAASSTVLAVGHYTGCIYCPCSASTAYALAPSLHQPAATRCTRACV
eukprot:364388-Chlamydomonas_euryale.AAC.4